MKLFAASSYEDYGWVFVETSPGRRLCRDEVKFDTKREDVRVTPGGVVLFYNADTARMLLKRPDLNFRSFA